MTAERILYFRKSKADSIRFAISMERMLAEGRLFEAAQQHAGKDGGYLGRTMESGLKAFVRTTARAAGITSSRRSARAREAGSASSGR